MLLYNSLIDLPTKKRKVRKNKKISRWGPIPTIISGKRSSRWGKKKK